MSNNLDALRAELQALTARVAALEQQASEPGSQPPPIPITDKDQYWALTGLHERLLDHPSTAAGAVMIVGSLTLPDNSPVSWQVGRGTTGMLETEWSENAATFAALGHPVRLELLRQILNGTHTTADLAEIEPLGTTGQLHHHLKHLVATGWVRQSGRGVYEVPAPRIVPLLTCLLGAQR